MINKQVMVGLLQLSIAAGLLVLLFYHLDMQKVGELIGQATPVYLYLALLVLVSQMAVAGYRWLYLLRMAAYHPKLEQCVGSFAAGALVNAVLPGGIGGDMMRMWVTKRIGIPTKTAIYSVVVDRIIALVGLGVLVALVSLGYMITTTSEPDMMEWIALAIGVVLLGGIVGLGLFAPVIQHFHVTLPSLFSPIMDLSRMVGLIAHHPRQLAVMVMIILAGHGLLITSIIAISYGLHAPLELAVACIALPMALLLSAIPITPGGWGIREGAMVLVLGQFGIAAEIALSISIVFGIGSTLATLPAASWWFGRRSWRKQLDTAATDSAAQ